MTEGQRKYIKSCRESYEVEGTNKELLARNDELEPNLTRAQSQELDSVELVMEIDDKGWALTLGGVWLDTRGTRHFGPVGVNK